jgi:hypothetical protein
VTGAGAKTLKHVALPALLLLLAGCSSGGQSAYSDYFTLVRQSVSNSIHGARVTRAQAAAISYASLGYRIDDGDQNILVLATDSNGEQLWTAGNHVVLLMRQGRIMRTVGLGHDLAALTGNDLPPLTAALKQSFTSTRMADYPDLGRYGVPLSCTAIAKGRQTIVILGQAIPTDRIDESCVSTALNWSFTNSYWLDPDSGLAWRTRQHVHPKGGTLETEIFRPPG